MTDEERRVILQAFIERVEVKYNRDRSLQLLIRWRDGHFDEVFIPRRATCGKAWAAQDVELLDKMLNSGATNVEIAAAFPSRTWGAIRQKIYSRWGKDDIRRLGHQGTIRPRETHADFVRRMETV